MQLGGTWGEGMGITTKLFGTPSSRLLLRGATLTLFQGFARTGAGAPALSWGKWEVFFADERLVPPDHPDSNYKACADALLSKVGIPPENVHAVSTAGTPQAAADAYPDLVRSLGCRVVPAQ